MPGWHFSIIGPGCDSDPLLLNLIQKYDLADQVSLLPVTDDPYEQIRKASCVIMPSRYEGFGLVALEALSIGRPVIASNADGLRDFVINEVNGLTFPCKNIDELSKCLVRIRNHPNLLKELANRTSISIAPFSRNLILHKWSNLAMRLLNNSQSVSRKK
jgi:glycosyltransferase involved in cell wall biosynthesis